MVNLVKDELFYVRNSVTYPPFKNGFYLEPFFLNYMQQQALHYDKNGRLYIPCLLYTSPSPRDRTRSRMPSSA